MPFLDGYEVFLRKMGAGSGDCKGAYEKSDREQWTEGF